MAYFGRNPPEIGLGENIDGPGINGDLGTGRNGKGMNIWLSIWPHDMPRRLISRGSGKHFMI